MVKVLILLFSLGLNAYAAPSIEAIRASANSAIPVPFKPFKLANRHITLSGDAQLSGTGWINGGGGGSTHVSVPLHGTVRVSGDGGKVQGNGSISGYASVWIHNGGGYVSDFVQYSASVSLYRDGRYVGTTTISGSVNVSGWASGSTLRLDGRGSASGSAFIPEPPQS